MALPKRVEDDDQDEGRQLSALERAHKSWGMSPTSNSEESPAQEAADSESSALDKARERWGEADVLSGKSKENEDSSDEETGGSGFKYSPEKDKPKSRFRGLVFNRKTAVGGGISGLIAAGLFGLFSIGQGPLQLIHLSQLLTRFHFTNNQEFNNDRSVRRLYYLAKGEAERSRLGRLGNSIADKVEVKFNEAGLKSVYGEPPGRRFRGYEILDESKAKNYIDDMLRDGLKITERDGKKFIELRDTSFRQRRSIIRTVSKASGLNRIASFISSRLMIRRGGIDMHPAKNIVRKAGDSLQDYRADLKEDRNERNRTGVDEDIIKNPEADETDRDGDGEPDGPDPELDEAEKAAKEVLDEVGDVGNGSPEATAALKKSILGKLVKGGTAATAAVGILCVMKELGNGAEKLKYTQTVLPMIRTSMMFISVGSQIQTGQDVNMDEIGSFASELYDESNDAIEETLPSSVFSALPMQIAMGVPGTGVDIARHLRPGELGEKMEFFKQIDDIPGLKQACGISNFLGGLPIIRQLGDFTSSVISSAIPIDALVNGVIGWIAGKGMDYGATGGPLGAILMYGGRLAANNQSAASGGVEMENTESIELTMYNQESVYYEYKQRSFLARTFDAYDSRSLVSQLALSMPRSINGLFSSLLSFPSRLATVFSPEAFAQATSYDYGFNEVGFTVDEINNELIADPYKNAEVVEPHLAELNDKYGKPCFNLTVTNIGNNIKINNGDMSYNPSDYKDELEECATSDDPMLLRYRAYVADAVGARAEACWEGIDEAACTEMGFGASIGSPAAPNGITVDYSLPPPERLGSSNAYYMNWEGLEFSDEIGPRSDGSQMKVYIRQPTVTNDIKTVVIIGSIHGSENAGQFVAYDMLFRARLPSNIRVIAIPEVLPQSSITAGSRKNANGVDLNRNFPKNWGNVNSDRCNVSEPSCMFYRGPSPASEAETQTLMNYLSGLGRIDLLLTYHDNLNYVAPVGDTDHSVARIYANASDMHGQCSENPSSQNCPIKTVWQSGSMDWWYNDAIGSPTILVEMGQDQSADIIAKHVNAISTVLGGN